MIAKQSDYGTTKTGYATTPVWCRGGSRYVEGCWGFRYLKIKLFFHFDFHFVYFHFMFIFTVIVISFISSFPYVLLYFKKHVQNFRHVWCYFQHFRHPYLQNNISSMFPWLLIFLEGFFVIIKGGRGSIFGNIFRSSKNDSKSIAIYPEVKNNHFWIIKTSKIQ